jgi:hypothetical protein
MPQVPASLEHPASELAVTNEEEMTADDKQEVHAVMSQ